MPITEGEGLFRSLLIILFPALLAGIVLLSSCSEDDPTTPPQLEPPAILGQDVSEITHQAVTLGGWVDGHGRSTVCWFDYGNDITFGARTPDLDAGDMAGSVRVEYNLTGLDPDKVHWWRMVAVAGQDTAFAADTTFTTLIVPNELPSTHTTHPPHENNPVHFAWTGSDPDGEVIGFRWRLSDNGQVGIIDESDTLGLPWNFTTATDSVFSVSADQPAPRDPEDTGPHIFFRAHTFWIKAVDNLGAEDPSPAYVSFTAVTEAPEVQVTVSPSVDPMPDGCLELPLPISFTWTASDSDSPADALLETRTLLVSLSDLGIDACLTQAEYELLDPLAAVAGSLWSEWQQYDPQSQIPPALNLGPEHVGGRYLFAVMARDGAGAWTEALTWGGNVWQVEVLPD
jgi:hypothetical protein